MTNEERGALIQRWKGMPEGGEGAVFPIRDWSSLSALGCARALDCKTVQDDGMMAKMARWHTMYKAFFLTQFDVTPENKRAWLAESVLRNPKKMLFLVETLDGRVVGQDGFTLLEEGAFELDGAMRGERGGGAGLFMASMLESAAICFSLLACETAYARAFHGNAPAIYGLKLAGFEQTHEQALRRVRREGKVTYAPMENGRADADAVLLSFKMERELFVKWHGHLLDFSHCPDAAGRNKESAD